MNQPCAFFVVPVIRLTIYASGEAWYVRPDRIQSILGGKNVGGENRTMVTLIDDKAGEVRESAQEVAKLLEAAWIVYVPPMTQVEQ